jgi:hypothetical protein
VVERHDGADRVEATEGACRFDSLLNETRMLRRPRVDAEGVESSCRETLDESTVPATDIEHACSGRDGVANDGVEATPPSIVSH